MKKIFVLFASVLPLFFLCACVYSEMPNSLLSDLEIDTIDLHIVLYDDNGEEVEVEDASFLENYVYAYNLPTERIHELFLFPSTKMLQLDIAGETVGMIFILADGDIVTARDEEGNHRVYRAKR